MATPDQNLQQEADYSAAFAEDGAPAAAPAAEPAGEPAGGLDVEAAADASPADAAPDAASADVVADAAPAADVDGEEVLEDPALERQRLKSWAGRLKAMKRDLDAKAAATGEPKPEIVADALEEVADKADEAGEGEMSDAVEAVADKVDSGEMNIDQAMAVLSEDFGEPFVRMIEAVARRVAAETTAEKVGDLDKRTQDIIDHIKDGQTKAHFEAIAAAHPDFNEVATSPEFQAWTAEDPARQELVQDGGTQPLIALLTEYKAKGDKGGEEPAAVVAVVAPADDAVDVADSPADEAEIDAAEGVRQGGLTLPDEPQESSDFGGAWADFDKEERKRT